MNGDTYRLGINREFIARHYLVGGDWGAENRLHSHHYRVEVVVQGTELDEHGYLIDIVELQTALDGVIGRIGERTLNDLPEFAGLNPSLEHFARIFRDLLVSQVRLPGRSLSVRLWENENNWASCRGTSSAVEAPPR